MTTHKEALTLARSVISKDVRFFKSEKLAAITVIDAALAQPEQEPVAWVPYLSDRADGVKGRYAIARWNPRGYREVWNLRRHEWGAYSDDVLSLEEADTLLRLITIPTRKVTSPQPPQPKEPEQEPVVIQYASKAERDLYEMEDEDDTTTLQRKPLTKSQVLDLWEQTYVQRGSTGIEFARAIEAAHGIKE